MNFFIPFLLEVGVGLGLLGGLGLAGGLGGGLGLLLLLAVVNREKTRCRSRCRRRWPQAAYQETRRLSNPAVELVELVLTFFAVAGKLAVDLDSLSEPGPNSKIAVGIP